MYNVNFPRSGLSLAEFNDFVSLCGGVEALRGKSTEDVCNQFIREFTKNSRSSYVSLLDAQAIAQGRETIRSDASVFISHSWNYNFLEVFTTIKNHFCRRGDILIWMDIFCISQHYDENNAFGQWRVLLKDEIRRFNYVVIVCLPWEDPQVFHRSWCVYESFLVLRNKGRFETAFSLRHRFEVSKIRRKDPQAITRMLKSIDIEYIQSFIPSDSKRILDEIELSDLGVTGMNQLLRQAVAYALQCERLMPSVISDGKRPVRSLFDWSNMDKIAAADDLIHDTSLTLFSTVLRSPSISPSITIKPSTTWVARYFKPISLLFDQSNLNDFQLAEQSNDRQAAQHTDKACLFYYVREGLIDILHAYFDSTEIEDEEKRLLADDRDEAGANIIHAAYLYGQYEIGHYLVQCFPDIASRAYATSNDEDEVVLPYGGENILHMCIISKNIEQLKWLLEFYGRDENAQHMQTLMESRAVGTFFNITNISYFGELPLHFAACTNNQEIFELILNYNQKQDSKSIIEHLLQRDSHGNTLLHICVIKVLTRMFHYIRQRLIIELEKYIEKEFDNLLDHNADIFSDIQTDKRDSDMKYVYRLVKLNARGIKPRNEDESKFQLWLNRAALNKEAELLTKSLNDDGHSPLTLAAKEANLTMLGYLLDERRMERYTYGPTTVSMFDLDGVDSPVSLRYYAFNNKAKDKVTKQDRLNAFDNYVVRDLVLVKWDKIGKSSLHRAAVFAYLVTALITILAVANEYDSYNTTTTQQRFYIFLYLAIGGLLGIKFLLELPSMLRYGTDFWGLGRRNYGIRGAPRLERVTATLRALSFAAYILLKAVSASIIDTPSSISNIDLDQPIRYAMMICSLSAWMHLYYFMMAFEATGPLVIVIYYIISESLTFFIQFFIIIVLAAGCAFVLITNDGSYPLGGNLYYLLQTWWNLIQLTAGFKESISREFIPENMEWSYELLITFFSIAATILILNLLIASASNLLTRYTKMAGNLYLLEKFNIMYGMDRMSYSNHAFINMTRTVFPFTKHYLDQIFARTSAENDLKKYAIADNTDPDHVLWYHKMEEIDKNWSK